MRATPIHRILERQRHSLPRPEDCENHEHFQRRMRHAARRFNPAPGILTQGWVYVIRVVDTQYVKIGMTLDRDPLIRVRSIAMSMPFDLKIVALGKATDVKVFEGILHDMFQPQRIRGEWFNLNQDDIKAIVRMPHFQHEPGFVIVQGTE